MFLSNFCDIDMQINPEEAREEFRASVSKDGGTGVKDFMDSVGLGAWVGEVTVIFHQN
jgi:arsenite-transporting ATPase